MTPWTDRAGRFSPLKAATLALLLAPAAWLAVKAASGGLGQGVSAGPLGPRPLTEAIHETGDWAIRFLWLSLAVTPLRRLLDWPKLVIVRRMVGLAAFFYALGHFLLYVADMSFDVGKVASEIVLRIYLTIGFVALAALAVLASTSTDAAIRRLGRRWNQLHRIVYVIGVLAALHFFMQTKLDVYEATLMAGLFTLLMLYRILQARGLSLTALPVTIGTAIVAGIATAAIEAAWYGLATGVPVGRVLSANLAFGYSIRPAWWVLAIGLTAAVAAALRTRAPQGGRGRPARVTRS